MILIHWANGDIEKLKNCTPDLIKYARTWLPDIDKKIASFFQNGNEYFVNMKQVRKIEIREEK